MFKALDDYLGELRDGPFALDFELIYFNSSSAKAIMSLLEKLDELAARNGTVTINWYYDEEDDTMRELGAEFGEDLKRAEFNVKTADGMNFEALRARGSGDQREVARSSRLIVSKVRSHARRSSSSLGTTRSY